MWYSHSKHLSSQINFLQYTQLGNGSHFFLTITTYSNYAKHVATKGLVSCKLPHIYKTRNSQEINYQQMVEILEWIKTTIKFLQKWVSFLDLVKCHLRSVGNLLSGRNGTWYYSTLSVLRQLYSKLVIFAWSYSVISWWTIYNTKCDPNL